MNIEQTIVDQAEQVRQEGRFNMMDRNGVQTAAYDNELYDLVTWIEEHDSGEYMALLNEVGRQAS